MNDPREMHNLCSRPESAAIVEQLKQQLSLLKREARDDDQFADRQPEGSINTRIRPAGE